jgi:hypothetical protein
MELISVRVRVVDIDGTPEELDRAPILRELLGNYRKDNLLGEGAPRGANHHVVLLPSEVTDLIETQAPHGKSGAILRSFITEVLGWGDVEAVRGESSKRDDGMARYFRLHRRGSSLGGFAYVWPRPRRIKFRVETTAADGLKHAVVRKVKSRNPYKVAIRIFSEEAKSEALILARQAYEAALPEE